MLRCARSTSAMMSALGQTTTPSWTMRSARLAQRRTSWWRSRGAAGLTVLCAKHGAAGNQGPLKCAGHVRLLYARCTSALMGALGRTTTPSGTIRCASPTQIQRHVNVWSVSSPPPSQPRLVELMFLFIFYSPRNAQLKSTSSALISFFFSF